MNGHPYRTAPAIDIEPPKQSVQSIVDEWQYYSRILSQLHEYMPEPRRGPGVAKYKPIKQAFDALRDKLDQRMTSKLRLFYKKGERGREG